MPKPVGARLHEQLSDTADTIQPAKLRPLGAVALAPEVSIIPEPPKLRAVPSLSKVVKLELPLADSPKPGGWWGAFAA